MSAFSELVNIKFEDATSYTASFTDDILCLPFFHPWGPRESFETMLANDFLLKFQESPICVPSSFRNEVLAGATPSASTIISMFKNWAQIKRAFAAGMGYVLACNINVGKTLYFQAAYSSGAWGTPNLYAGSSKVSGCLFGLKYPGIPTYADLGLDATQDYRWGVKITKAGDVYTLQILARIYSATTPFDDPGNFITIESFDGTFNKTDVVDGESYYLPNVVNNKSQFLSMFEESYPNGLPEGMVEFTDDSIITDLFTISGISNWYTTNATALRAKLEDPEITNFTLLISPIERTVAGSYDDPYKDLCSTRKDANLLVGFPVAGAFNKATIESDFLAVQNALAGDKFYTGYVQGREKYEAMGYTFLLDCTAGWAGRLAAVAQQVRLNQLPSAKQYGAYPGTLTESLTFSEVLQLHDIGCDGVYLASTGPCIFGVRSCHKRQQSYFGKFNISRVTARLVKYIIPEVMNVIHTEVVSDPIERAKFNNAMLNILNEFIAAGNIKPQSMVDVSDAINSDSQTKGGEILNVLFVVYFKKLAERVNIKVVATDSSVAVSVS